MSFDGFTVAAVVAELKKTVAGGRVERVNAPTFDEIVLIIRTEDRRSVRLCLSASSNIPKVHLTDTVKDNPAQASALCMHLRKHLNSAKIVDISQPDFERVIRIDFDTLDEMGFLKREIIFAEIMGKYSNVILTDESFKIINCIKQVDITTSSKRQVLPGMKYEAPPPQDKLIPYNTGEDEFFALCDKFAELCCDDFFIKNFRGFSPLLSREAARLAQCSGEPAGLHKKALYAVFRKFVSSLKEGDFSPCIIYNGKKPFDYAAINITQYGGAAEIKNFSSISDCIDAFYSERENNERIKQRGADILRIVTASETRIKKKIARQKEDIAACDEAEKFKLWADLITANIYRLKKGQTQAELENYYSDEAEIVVIPLDFRLSPAQNAQKYYKKYNKLKTAFEELTKRIKMSESELEYIATVADALFRSETEEDLDMIREELFLSGYASKMKDKAKRKFKKTKPLHYKTSGGYDVYVGRNNIENDRLTLKDSSRFDWFFHVKGAPGSHVIMVTDGVEPEAEDFTQAAMLAAYHSSKRDGVNVEVDYTQVRNVKKPSGGAPGLVIYHTNYSAVVTADAETVEKLRCEK